MYGFTSCIRFRMSMCITFRFLTNPAEITPSDDGWVKSVVCQEMVLSEPDASGRAKAVPKEGAFTEINADCVIIAIGTS